MPKILNERVASVERLAPSIYKMSIESEYVSQNAVPGQFVNVKCSEGLNALLRRPISICRVDRSNGVFDIVFQIKGLGTEYLSRKSKGDIIDIIAPLGKSFDTSDRHNRIAVIGGGIGVFPLLYLLDTLKAPHKNAFLGFRNSDYVVLRDEFAKAAPEGLFISTDDGSEGHKGLVTELFVQEIEKKAFDIVYTCGPMPMIRKVVEIAHNHGIKCQVSLEQRMGCGIGACLVCACKTKHGDDWEYSHVCADGPVFWSGEVILD